MYVEYIILFQILIQKSGDIAFKTIAWLLLNLTNLLITRYYGKYPSIFNRTLKNL